MARNRNQFHFSAVESESISLFGMESESNYHLGESVLGPNPSFDVSFSLNLDRVLKAR